MKLGLVSCSEEGTKGITHYTNDLVSLQTTLFFNIASMLTDLPNLKEVGLTCEGFSRGARSAPIMSRVHFFYEIGS